jgi:hypothetical protein
MESKSQYFFVSIALQYPPGCEFGKQKLVPLLGRQRLVVRRSLDRRRCQRAVAAHHRHPGDAGGRRGAVKCGVQIEREGLL